MSIVSGDDLKMHAICSLLEPVMQNRAQVLGHLSEPLRAREEVVRAIFESTNCGRRVPLCCQEVVANLMLSPPCHITNILRLFEADIKDAEYWLLYNQIRESIKTSTASRRHEVALMLISYAYMGDPVRKDVATYLMRILPSLYHQAIKVLFHQELDGQEECSHENSIANLLDLPNDPNIFQTAVNCSFVYTLVVGAWIPAPRNAVTIARDPCCNMTIGANVIIDTFGPTYRGDIFSASLDTLGGKKFSRIFFWGCCPVTFAMGAGYCDALNEKHPKIKTSDLVNKLTTLIADDGLVFIKPCRLNKISYLETKAFFINQFLQGGFSLQQSTKTGTDIPYSPDVNILPDLDRGNYEAWPSNRMIIFRKNSSEGSFLMKCWKSVFPLS